jgi:hypothetical protein
MVAISRVLAFVRSGSLNRIAGLRLVIANRVGRAIAVDVAFRYPRSLYQFAGKVLAYPVVYLALRIVRAFVRAIRLVRRQALVPGIAIAFKAGAVGKSCAFIRCLAFNYFAAPLYVIAD